MTKEQYFKPHYLIEEYFKHIEYPKHERCNGITPYVYLIVNPITKLTKIGVTNNPQVRYMQLVRQNGVALELLIYIKLGEEIDETSHTIESYLHNYFNHKRKFGEWFDLSAKDIIAIWNLFWIIEGDYIKDNVKQFINFVK